MTCYGFNSRMWLTFQASYDFTNNVVNIGHGRKYKKVSHQTAAEEIRAKPS